MGLVPLGFEDCDKTIRPHDFSIDLLDQEVKCVVVGSDSRMNYYKLIIASSYLRDVPGCRFVGTSAYVLEVAGTMFSVLSLRRLRLLACVRLMCMVFCSVSFLAHARTRTVTRRCPSTTASCCPVEGR